MVVGLVALATTLALVVQVGAMRLAQRRSDAKATAMRARWRPLLLRRAMGEPAALPVLAVRDQIVFLVLWNQIADSLRGPSYDRLREVIVELALDHTARRWLQERNPSRQLLGLLTLGHLGASSDWSSLRRRLGDSRTYMSLAAARALLQVDAALAVDPVLDELARRADWPIARIAGLLRAASADKVFEPVLRRLQQAATLPSSRVARMLAAIDGVRASATLVRLMQRSDDTELLSTCLQHVQTPAALPRVRALARHPLWWIRVQAAAALGRLGDRDDRALLLVLLTDPNWWVRYRAAVAFVRMPGLAPEAIAALADGLTDRFARDVLHQALAEAAAT